MSYKITKVDSEVIVLSELDETGETTATIRRATGKDELSLQRLQTSAKFDYKIGDAEVSESTPLPKYVSTARKVWLTMEDCNIQDVDGTKYFTKGMEWADFLAKWGEMDLVAHEALFDAVVTVNKHWGN